MISEEEIQRSDALIKMMDDLIEAIDQFHEGKISEENLMTQRCITRNQLSEIKEFYLVKKTIQDYIDLTHNQNYTENPLTKNIFKTIPLAERTRMCEECLENKCFCIYKNRILCQNCFEKHLKPIRKDSSEKGSEINHD